MFYKGKNKVRNKVGSKTLTATLCILCVVTSGLSQTAHADNITYILAARQSALLKNMDRVADMSANANTTGFKAENDIFTVTKKTTSPKEKLSFSKIGGTSRDTSQGGLVQTGRQLDAAISGKGYFMVNSPYGELLTRAGNFKVSEEGILVTQDGYPLMGPGGGQVEFTENDVEISIKEDGLVAAGSEERGQIGVFIVDDENAMERVGKGYYRTREVARVSDQYQVVQGMLEESNVNSVTAMTNLVEVSRNFENITKLQASHNELQLGMIRGLTK